MKYKVDNLKNYAESKGWICGHFLNKKTIQKNHDIEVNIATFQPGHTASEHFHPKSKMVIFIMEGKLKMVFDNKEFILTRNDFAYLEKGVHESVVEVFEPTTIICIRTPSLPNNKIEM